MRIGTATVTYYPEGAFTSYDDGAEFAAQPHDTPHYDEIARRCGYFGSLPNIGFPLPPTAARLAYAREHEVCHHIVSEWIGGHTSKVLWPLAHGRDPDPFDAVQEEALTMTFQRWLRANERPIIGGVDWDGLKARALTLLWEADGSAYATGELGCSFAGLLDRLRDNGSEVTRCLLPENGPAIVVAND